MCWISIDFFSQSNGKHKKSHERLRDILTLLFVSIRVKQQHRIEFVTLFIAWVGSLRSRVLAWYIWQRNWKFLILQLEKQTFSYSVFPFFVDNSYTLGMVPYTVRFDVRNMYFCKKGLIHHLCSNSVEFCSMLIATTTNSKIILC